MEKNREKPKKFQDEWDIPAYANKFFELSATHSFIKCSKNYLDRFFFYIYEFSICNQLHTLLPQARFLESNVCDFQLQKVYGAKIQT